MGTGYRSYRLVPKLWSTPRHSSPNGKENLNNVLLRNFSKVNFRVIICPIAIHANGDGVNKSFLKSSNSCIKFKFVNVLVK